MKQSPSVPNHTLSVWLKGVILSVGAWGVLLYAWVLPMLTDHLLETRVSSPLPKGVYLAFVCFTAVPCIAELCLAWTVASRIGQNRSFSRENASAMAWMAYLLFGDAWYFLCGNAVLLALGKSAPDIMLLSVLICVIVVAVAVAFAALSHLIRRASRMEAESRLTI